LSTDWFTKLVLTVLAASAAFIAAQGLRGGGSRSAEDGRYRLQVIPMARMMLKIDSDTGKTWKTSFPEPKFWTPIDDERADTLDDAPAKPPEDELEDEVEAQPEAKPEAKPEAQPEAPETPAAPPVP
jgi:hypothetical protein